MAQVVVLKLNYGTAAQLDEAVGSDRQLVIETDTHRPRVMDGKTKGGFRLAFASDISEQSAAIAANAAAISNLKTSIKTLCDEIVAAKGA